MALGMVLRAALGTALGALSLVASPLAAQETDAEPVVRAVLFYSPTCPHCHDVMTNSLPPLLERHGARLRIVAVNTMLPEGQQLYRATVLALAIPPDRLGVPTLVVASRVLVGALEIPLELPGIVDAGLAAGGIDWPEVPSLREAIVAGGEAVTVLQAAGHSGTEAGTEAGASPGARFLMDPAGNLASVAVLLLMVVALAVVAETMTGRRFRLPEAPGWTIPALAVVGLGVAAYLTVVEVTGAEAVCGPVGDCNAVQQSEYARFFGIPVGLLGVAAYAALILAWGLGALGPQRIRHQAHRTLWGMALAGTLFSIYLTFLEPFVIGATCAWCLASAAIVTLILLAATGGVTRSSGPGRAEVRRAPRAPRPRSRPAVPPGRGRATRRPGRRLP
jgi:uncharacterized membrane protein